MSTLSIKDVDSGDQLVRYSSAEHAYLPCIPFYMCAKCFETIVTGETPTRSLFGSALASHRCIHHPRATILFSSANPNLGRIPWIDCSADANEHSMNRPANEQPTNRSANYDDSMLFGDDDD
jgi:hypothetical protein